MTLRYQHQPTPTMPSFAAAERGGDREVRAPAMAAPHQTLRFQRRQTLYHGGEPAESVFLVRDGLVRIARMTPEGRVLTVRHVLPGDFFGEEAFNDGTREEIAEALTNAQIEAIDPTHINPADLMTITRSLSNQLQRQMEYGYHLQTGDLRQRVARYLLTLADTPLARRDPAGRAVVSATHELIAEGTAATRESVSKIITELRAEGAIQSGYRSITLVDPDALDAIAEGF
jgi:CRP/FNR family transcriptional regulator, LitR-dependent transcriptional activator